MSIHANIRCPACQGALIPTALHCDACDLSVTGRFAANEFASLDEENLHFLRIFVLCEGRIREMESALGVSYPTIKGKLAKLKESLAAPAASPPVNSVPQASAEPSASTAVLRDLEAGRISFDQAMAHLKGLQPTQLKDGSHER